MAVTSMLDSLFQAVTKGMELYDQHNKTKYASQFKDILEAIRDEEAKPIYSDNKDQSLRDQNIIDRAHFDLMLLTNSYVTHASKVAGPDTPPRPQKS